MSKVDGIDYAVTSSAIQNNQVPNKRIYELVKNNHHPKRSGDIYLIFSARSYINNMDGLSIASTHGSPWRYDTHVPVIFAGHNVKSKRIGREVTPYDVAPTLSNYLGITLPSGAIGQVLTEVTD